MNNTTDEIFIVPYKKLINKSISDILDKLVTIYGSHVVPNTNANVIIPDTIGDSVKLEENIPNPTYTRESNKNPNIDVKYIGIFGTL